MGVIARRLSETRDRGDWLAADDKLDMVPATSAGIRVNRQAALGLSTVWRCVDLLSSAVAQAPKDVVVKIGGKSFPEFGTPAWLVTPNPADQTYTINDYFAQVAISLLMDGNYFVVVSPHILDPQALTVIDPALMNVKPGPSYELKDQTGRVIRTYTQLEVLHGTWIRPAGQLRGISPLETLRRSMGAAIAAEEHASRFFGQGAALSFGVEVPGPMTKQQKEDLADSLKARYAGLGQAHAIGVLTNGGKFVTGLAPTPEQAQMLATRQFSVEDLCRPFGVPPHMAGSQQPGASSYASADVNREVFVERSVVPLAERIEAQHDRLLTIPDNLATVQGVTIQFKFNLDGISRGNILQRMQGYQAAVFAGVLKPNEARAKEDLPPDPLGDQLFMQSGTVPISTLVSAPTAATPSSEAPPL